MFVSWEEKNRKIFNCFQTLNFRRRKEILNYGNGLYVLFLVGFYQTILICLVFFLFFSLFPKMFSIFLRFALNVLFSTRQRQVTYFLDGSCCTENFVNCELLLFLGQWRFDQKSLPLHCGKSKLLKKRDTTTLRHYFPRGQLNNVPSNVTHGAKLHVVINCFSVLFTAAVIVFSSVIVTFLHLLPEQRPARNF